MSAPRCPHCHTELHALPDGSVPELCPYCGNDLPLDVGPSLATLLRPAPAARSMPTPLIDARAADDRATQDRVPDAQRSDTAPVAHDTIEQASEGLVALQEKPDTADNAADLPAPKAAKTSALVIDPETMRHATPDTNAPAPSETPQDDAAHAAPSSSQVIEDASALRAPGTGVHVPAPSDTSVMQDSATVIAPAADAPPAHRDRAPDEGEETASPSFIAPSKSAPRMRVPRLQWGIAGALVVLLSVQLLLSQRDVLASDAQWRPWMTRLCGVAGCTLAPWRELSAFHMQGRDVRGVSGRPGVLQLQATFRNDATWPQPLPALRVSLSDADGRVVGARILQPAEYLPAGDPQALLAPGQSVQASALLGEPNVPTVAFAFEFR
ncbi:MAG: DUF3426 domain-containing protein [Pseudoxanthomonas sp.]